MDRHGITIYLFFYDDGARVWNTGDEVGSKEREFLRTIVNRFKGLKRLVWVVAEEYNEAYTPARVSNIAAEIKEADDHNHLVAVHKQPGIDFSEFASDPSIDQFAIQLRSSDIDQLHRQVVDAWVKASNRYSINMAEAPDWGSGAQARHKAWAVAMSGAHVMVYKMFIDNTPVSDLEDLGRLVAFMESANFGELEPRDDLAYDGTDYVLASLGETYIAYARNLSGNVGIRDMRAGTYDFTWYDPVDGSRITQNDVGVSAGDQTWSQPAEIGTEVALYIKKKGKSGGKSRISRTFPSTTWQFRDPIELGLEKSKLDELSAQAEGSGCVVRHGFMAYCWGQSHNRGDWASAGKPVLSTLLFIAISEGLVGGVDDPIRNWNWQLKKADRNITFRHLANMTSGYARGEPPGAGWAYNDLAISLYGLTLKRVFNSDLDQVALNRLSALQFEDGSVFGSRGGIGVDASIRDFARIGWFWLNKGNWNGTQLLPTRLFEDYVRPQVPSNLLVSMKDGNDYLRVGSFGGKSNQTKHGPGYYGFNWWFNRPHSATGPRFWPSAPDDTYQSNGHWGREVLIVIPSLDIVVSAKGNWGTQSGFHPGNREGAMNRNLQLLEQAVIDRKVSLNHTAPTPSTDVAAY
jgi:CubicO group peptidase (beta-lactamase class C family)